MKRLLVKLMTPGLVITGVIAVYVLAAIKMIEDKHDEDYFWE